MRKDIAVVILAGGEGSRIGGAKPLRTVGKERLIDRALRQAKMGSGPVAISVRKADQVQPVDAELLLDDKHVEGPLAGLISALGFAKASGCNFVQTIPADMPFLPEDLSARLLAAIGSTGCALPGSGGHVHPVCGLWRTTVQREIERYLGSGRRSLKGLAELVGCKTLEWPVGDVDPFFNINSARDLEQALRLI